VNARQSYAEGSKSFFCLVISIKGIYEDFGIGEVI